MFSILMPVIVLKLLLSIETPIQFLLKNRLSALSSFVILNIIRYYEVYFILNNSYNVKLFHEKRRNVQ